MPVESFQHEHALCQNHRQHDNYHVAAIAGIEEPTRRLGMLVMVLYQIANDRVGIDKPSFAHREPSRARARSAAAARISAKDIRFAFLLASAPLSDRMPGCTRMVARSPCTAYSSLAPA